MRVAIVDGEDQEAAQLAADGLAAGINALELVEQGFAVGIREAGRLFDEGEFFLPELVVAAQAMKAAMAVLEPVLQRAAVDSRAGTVVIGTVAGDIHDIGKTLVATLLSANGFQVYDEGADVPVARFVERAREVGADLVCASALLTTTMGGQRDLVQALREAGLAARVMVGGAPVTRAWAGQIGADGYAGSAASAVDEARRLIAHVG